MGKDIRSKKGGVIIGSDVWIGGGTTIMDGLTIGDGVSIAANSQVVKNVEPYSIVGGNPAELIKYRFSYDIVKRFLELKWWDFPDEVIVELTPFLCSSDIERFFEEAEKYRRKV